LLAQACELYQSVFGQKSESIQRVSFAKRVSYKAIRVRVVGLVVLSVVAAVTIIPSAVSSPGIPPTIDDRPVSSPTPSSVKPEHESFLPLDVVAPLPFLRSDAAESFNSLRAVVKDGAGFDFLERCGDMLRVGNGRVLKLGTAFNSRHKKGEAFDYNQEDPRVLLVREHDLKGVQWRTYLLCESSHSNKCAQTDLHTDNAGHISAYVFDFTAAAEQLGWQRIYAHPGWPNEPTKKEFWHYQLRR
jgi:hypothetical protein